MIKLKAQSNPLFCTAKVLPLNFFVSCMCACLFVDGCPTQLIDLNLFDIVLLCVTIEQQEQMPRIVHHTTQKSVIPFQQNGL